MSDRHPRPLLGDYYWFPRPVEAGLNWAVLTCHDLGFDAKVGHVDLWPAVVDRLAAAWGREARTLRRQLGHGYTEQPKGGALGLGERC